MNPPRMTRTLRIEPFLGHIDEHAEILVRIANATGCEVRENFNGDDILARPGDDSAVVAQGWERCRTLRQQAQGHVAHEFTNSSVTPHGLHRCDDATPTRAIT